MDALFANCRSAFGTVAFELHRRRRAAVSGLFSKSQAILEEPVIYNKVDLLFKQVDGQIARDGFAEMRMKYVLSSLLRGCVSANKNRLRRQLSGVRDR